MDTALRFRRRHALHAVTTGLKFQHAVHAITADLGNHLFITAMLAIAAADDFHPPATRFGKTAVHPEQITGKNGRFVTTRTGADFQITVTLIVRIFWQQQDLQLLLQLLDAVFRSIQLILRHIAHFGIIEQLFGGRQILLCLLPITETLHHIGQLGILFGQCTKALLIGNHRRLTQHRLNFFMALKQRL